MNAESALDRLDVGWIGVGRMGLAMASRLLDAGARIRAYNRTREKAEPLAAKGAALVDAPADLADCDIVFTMVAGPDSLIEVTKGAGGVLTRDDASPKLLVDCTTISTEAAAEVRAAANARGTMMLDAPVSGNAKVVDAGKLAIVASGERAAFDMAEPYLKAIAVGVTYVGEGEVARVVKICHNVFLGVVAQSLAEIAVLGDKLGVPRHALLDFINHSVMGSMFTGYKTPAYVKLDYTPTFTPPLLLKDMDLGLAAARAQHMDLPIAQHVRDIVQRLIDEGYSDCDFAALLELIAKDANFELKPEDVEVGTGL